MIEFFVVFIQTDVYEWPLVTVLVIDSNIPGQENHPQTSLKGRWSVTVLDNKAVEEVYSLFSYKDKNVLFADIPEEEYLLCLLNSKP